jgi:hypothetical protein
VPGVTARAATSSAYLGQVKGMSESET